MTATLTPVTLTPVTLTTGAEALKLQSPYDPRLPAKARALGGKFNGENKAWYFDPRDVDRIRQLALEVYGIDPLGDSPELVTIRLSLDEAPYEGSTLFLFGREIAHRMGRDDHVRLGQGVIIVEGGFAARGGSARYPALAPKEGTVLEIRDVPKGLVDSYKYPEAVQIIERAEPTVAPAIEQILALARTLSREQREQVIDQFKFLP